MPSTHILQKRKRGVETSNRILEQSAELFARKGYDGVSLREIAQASNIRESSLYNHFPSKQNILQALLERFAEWAPLSRPTGASLEQMFHIMSPEEIFKNVIFHVGGHMNNLLENTSIIIQNEKARNQQAAEAYYQHLVKEPADYYEELIHKMMRRGMIAKVNARAIAEQYNYASLSLTQEYFMAKNGVGNPEAVIKRMLAALAFYCQLLQPEPSASQ